MRKWGMSKILLKTDGIEKHYENPNNVTMRFKQDKSCFASVSLKMLLFNDLNKYFVSLNTLSKIFFM